MSEAEHRGTGASGSAEDGDTVDALRPGDSRTGDAGDQARVADPVKGFSGVAAATLVLQAIVVLLALPVVGAVGGGLRAQPVAYVLTVAMLLLLGAGLQRRRWALAYDLGLQVLVVAGGVWHVSIAVIGLIFVGVWALLLVLRRDVRRRAG